MKRRPPAFRPCVRIRAVFQQQRRRSDGFALGSGMKRRVALERNHPDLLERIARWSARLDRRFQQRCNDFVAVQAGGHDERFSGARRIQARQQPQHRLGVVLLNRQRQPSRDILGWGLQRRLAIRARDGAQRDDERRKRRAHEASRWRWATHDVACRCRSRIGTLVHLAVFPIWQFAPRPRHQKVNPPTESRNGPARRAPRRVRRLRSSACTATCSEPLARRGQRGPVVLPRLQRHPPHDQLAQS